MSDITELFARDPLDLTNDQIDAIVAEYRSRRHLFNTTGKAPSKVPAKKSLSDKLAEQAGTLGLEL